MRLRERIRDDAVHISSAITDQHKIDSAHRMSERKKSSKLHEHLVEKSKQ